MKRELLRFFLGIMIYVMLILGLITLLMLIDDEPFDYGIATLFGFSMFLFMCMRLALRRMKHPLDRE